VSAGAGAKGHRHYDWAFARLDHDGPPPADQAGRHWLTVRRNRATGELALYRCCTPRPTPLAVLVKVAGRRWTIEERFQTGKGLCGLDQHQVRRWHCWYRWVTLAMLAHAFLVVAAQAEHSRSPASPELIELSCNEVGHRFAVLVAPPAGRARPPAGLVAVAATPSGTRPDLPLPPTSRPGPMKLTGASRLRGEVMLRRPALAASRNVH
jgi:hypothetical protein